MNYRVSSSTWLGFKSCISVIFSTQLGKHGNGERINFWTDTWLSKPIVDLNDIPSNLQRDLKATLSDFIVNGRWSIPTEHITRSPSFIMKFEK